MNPLRSILLQFAFAHVHAAVEELLKCHGHEERENRCYGRLMNLYADKDYAKWFNLVTEHSDEFLAMARFVKPIGIIPKDGNWRAWMESMWHLEGMFPASAPVLVVSSTIANPTDFSIAKTASAGIQSSRSHAAHPTFKPQTKARDGLPTGGGLFSNLKG